MTIQTAPETDRRLVTAEELWRMPDDGFRYELVEGELHKMTPSGYDHGVTVVNLTEPLSRFIRAHKLGAISGAETGFKISENPATILAPDISFVRRERIPSPRPISYFPGAPDLAVEVVSPNDRVYEVDEKAERWLDAGAQAVWIVNPKRRTVEVRTSDGSTLLGEGDELDGGAVVPDFRCRVAEIFV